MDDAFFDLEPATGEDERLFVDLDGFEGPLDLLLELARRSKIDLHRISLLALVEQYLAFIEQARAVRLELAADYLVMAAWLAYLKSRLLLPREQDAQQPDVGELAAALAERLRRLDAIRAAARALQARPQLGRDFALRGAPDATLADAGPPLWTATVHDLLAAYVRQRRRRELSRVTLHKREVWSLAHAREALLPLLVAADWHTLDAHLAAFCTTPSRRRTVRASALSAVLEMVREGRLAVRQELNFAPLWIRSRQSAAT